MLGVLAAVVIVAVLIGLNGLYVAGEFSTVGARRARIQQAAEGGNRSARMLLSVVDDPRRLDAYIAASQVGITLSSIALGIYGQQQIAPHLTPILGRLPLPLAQGEGHSAAAAGASAIVVLLFLTGLQVVLGELVPKSLAIQYPESVAMATAVPMRLSADVVLRPLIAILNGSGELLLRLLGIDRSDGHGRVHSPEEILILVRESYHGGLIDLDERQLLRRAFRVRDTLAEHVAVPRTQLVGANVNRSLQEVLLLAAESAYTRILIYEGNLDHIIGFVHLRDLFRLYRQDVQADIRTILRPIPFVPESLPVLEVWNRLNETHSYLAVVFDEYGGTSGMVTREDLIEELFGEVQDEFDQERARIVQADDQRLIVRGDTLISELNQLLGLALPDEITHTVAGLLLSELGRFPRNGEELRLGDIRFRVESTSGRRVQQVSVLLPPGKTLPEGEVGAS